MRLILLHAFLILSSFVCFGQNNKLTLNSDSKFCLNCHAHNFYNLVDTTSNTSVKRHMYDIVQIDTLAYVSSNHKNLECMDCHVSDGFKTFPHPVSARFEYMYGCMDCHGNDPKYSKFHFEEIEKQYGLSIHAKAQGETFSCWQCHDPHNYKINVRNSTNIMQTIAYDNNICLGCHSNFERIQLLTDNKEINLIEKHDWLPNQSLHLSQVRCIECHAEMQDSALVAHTILPKNMAVKRCVECHSANSILMASLYKYKKKESRSDIGFLNSIMLSDSYVIGANRNVILNIVSVIIFGFALLFIGIHLVKRIKTNKKKENHL